MATDTETRLIKVIENQELAPDGVVLTPETRFGEDLTFDSLDMVELAMAVEEEFGVDLNDDDFKAETTIATAAAQIDGLLAAA